MYIYTYFRTAVILQLREFCFAYSVHYIEMNVIIVGHLLYAT